MKTRDGRFHRLLAGRTRTTAFILLAVASQAGCGREFFREWANQDASEAIFEKSRDPRWRIDQFSVEPPALSRYADPYDPDRPPAPPDDYATQALSPMPQRADNQLLIPVEGTGYLDMLEKWRRDHPVTIPGSAAAAAATAPTNPAGVNAPMAQPPDPSTPSPFNPGSQPAPNGNSGTNDGAMTPSSIPGGTIPVPTGTNLPPSASQVPKRSKDMGVTLSAFQQTGLPLPVPNAGPPSTPAPTTTPPADPLGGPPLGNDPIPLPSNANDLTKPVEPPPGQSREGFKAGEAMASELAGILVPKPFPFNEAEAAGYPSNSTPYVVDMQQAFTLGLINARIYQNNLESLYVSSLAVSLSRFQFTPQFIAGNSPTTATAAGALSVNPANQFLYQTRATGTPISSLNLGTVAGAGLVLQSGAKIVTGFANQVVFNFIGKNSFQPSVRSFIPLSIVQPFLRGGGKAVTLEPLTNAERSLVYAVRSFAKFRQEFVVATLVGGTISQFGSSVALLGFSGASSNDPTTGFLNVVEDIQLMENARSNIAAYEQLVLVYKELINGESSGLSQLQLDQVDSNLQGAKSTFIQTRNQYRLDNDSFKNQLGLPTDTPMIVSRTLMAKFKEVFGKVDNWQKDPRRELTQLPKFAAELPDLEDVIIDGRSVLSVYKNKKEPANEDELEDLLLAAERVALEHRLDYMNNRAKLYDAWRQLKVTANALQGVFNVTFTNQMLTPPTSNNPFGFLDQSKQFSLAIQTELPLVRLTERNAFRTALINYQSARRTLQNQEDALKLNIRNEIRTLHSWYLNYEIARKNFVLNIRVRDQAFEQIIAPPAPGAATQGAVQTNNLVGAQAGLLNSKNQLVTGWYQYQVARLVLYRDLGTLPFDEWEAMYELFPSEYHPDTAASAPRDAGTTRASATRVIADPPKEGAVVR